MRKKDDTEPEAYDEQRPRGKGAEHGVQHASHVVSSPVVSGRFASSPAPRRVYTITLTLTIALTLLGLGCHAPAPGAADRLVVETQMSKGPATAPVTIVEFSDYQ